MALPMPKPELKGIREWVNTKPLRLGELKGKVVLVEFWDYSCVNCVRSMPFVKALWWAYKSFGLVVIGVHTPEYEFAADARVVEGAASEAGVGFPVALDNDYASWRAFNNKYWPSVYLFDAKGELRFSHAGEGKYAEIEGKVRELLAEAGADVSKVGHVAPPEPAYSKELSKEMYLGSARATGFGSGKVSMLDGRSGYLDPGIHERNAFYISGIWEVSPEYVETNSEMVATLTVKFFAREANLVMSAPGKAASFKAYLNDSLSWAGNAGADLDEKTGTVTVSAPRLYRLFSGKDYAERELKLEFREKGVRCYSITFG